MMEKRAKPNARSVCADIPWRSRCAKGTYGVVSDCTPASLKSEASVLIKLMTKSARKLVVEPPVTVGLGFCTAAIHDISYDSLFTAKVFTAVKPCMARRVKESACKVTDRGSRMERALTTSVGKVERDINEKEGEVAFVEEGQDVERVTADSRNLPEKHSSGGWHTERHCQRHDVCQ